MTLGLRRKPLAPVLAAGIAATVLLPGHPFAQTTQDQGTSRLGALLNHGYEIKTSLPTGAPDENAVIVQKVPRTYLCLIKLPAAGNRASLERQAEAMRHGACEVISN